MDYVGSTFGPDFATKNQPCNYAVGLYDKATGSIQLLPIQGGKVARMDVRLHGLEYGPSSVPASEEASTREEKMAQNKRLVDSFGSTRRRRQMAAREDGIVRTDKLASPETLTRELGKKTNEAERLGITKDKVMQSVTTERIRNLPPHHVDARTFPEAYLIDEVIPAAARGCLREGLLLDAASQSHGKDSLANHRPPVPGYVLNRLSLLRDSDQGKARRRAQTLSFLSALFSLADGRPQIHVNSGPGGLEAIAKSYGMHPDLLQELLDLFSTRSTDAEGRDKYERSSQQKELLISYILVLVQLLEGAGIQAAEFEALRVQMKMSNQDLVLRFREIGSTCISTTMKDNDEVRGHGRVSSYNVFGLKEGKTLGESFPGIKMGARKK